MYFYKWPQKEGIVAVPPVQAEPQSDKGLHGN